MGLKWVVWIGCWWPFFASRLIAQAASGMTIIPAIQDKPLIETRSGKAKPFRNYFRPLFSNLTCHAYPLIFEATERGSSPP